MDTAIINDGAGSEAPAKQAEKTQRSVSEQLQTLNLYVYLDARRYGTAR